MRVEKRGAEGVGRPRGDHPGEDNAAVEIEIVEVAVGRAPGGATEQQDAGIGIAAGRPVELLIDHGIDAVVAAQPSRDAGAERIGQRKAVDVEAQIVEAVEVMPGADANAAGETGRIGLLIVAVLKFADHVRRIVDAEIQPVAVAEFGVKAALAGRIAVEHRQQRRGLRRRIDLQTHAGRR